MATNDQILTELASLRNDVKNVMKLLRKVNNRADDPDGTKAKARAENNGFNRPQNITQALSDFLDIPNDEMISRSEVTRRVNAYIREHNLKHEENGRVIMVENDAKLKALLNPADGEQVTFLNIQRFLSPHYVKVEKPAEAQVNTEATGESSTASVSSSPSPIKKKPTVVKKKPTVRKPVNA
jgi:chromatin remodeling complex protein RSC6